MSTITAISLGSNLGDRRAALDGAVTFLGADPEIEVLAVSRYLETDPVGGPTGQGAFLNAAAVLRTSLNPASLHERLREAERREGRVRLVRWDARTLDLDLLLFGPLVYQDPDLIIPHPRLAFRRFVLAPLAEIGSDLLEPITGRSVSDLLANLDRRPSHLTLLGDPAETRALRELLTRSIGDDWIVTETPTIRHVATSSTLIALIGGGSTPQVESRIPILRVEGTRPTMILEEIRSACLAGRVG